MGSTTDLSTINTVGRFFFEPETALANNGRNYGKGDVKWK